MTYEKITSILVIPVLFFVSCTSVEISRVPNQAKGNMFSNQTQQVGLPIDFKANQTVVADLNLDGYEDIIFTQWHVSPITTRIFMNDHGQKFVEYAVSNFKPSSQAILKIARGLFGFKGWGVVVRNPNQPLRGFQLTVNDQLKQVSFEPVAAGVMPSAVSSWGDIQLFDYDQDGQLDMVATSFYDNRMDYSAGPLFLFKGGKSFSDISKEVGLQGLESRDVNSHDATVPSYMANVCDMDNDGKMDLLIAGYGRRWNKIMFNREGIYKNMAEELEFDGDKNGKSDFRGNGNSFSPTCGDVDQDGKLDIFQGEITHQWAGSTSDLSSLLLNRYPKPFERFTNFPRPRRFDNQSDLGSAFGDLDLNGSLDLVLANSDYPPETKMLIFSKQEGIAFENISAELGEEVINPKGLVLFDFDHDGDLDLVTGENAMRGHVPSIKFFKNMTQENAAIKKKFLVLQVEGDGEKIPLSPVGTQAVIMITEENQNTKLVRRDALFGAGQDAQMPLTLHFPLAGLNDTKVMVNLKWNQDKSEFLTFDINKTYRVKYNKKQSVVTEFK